MRLCKVTGTYIISIKGDRNCIRGVNNFLATSRMNIDIILLIFYYIILFYLCSTSISAILAFASVDSDFSGRQLPMLSSRAINIHIIYSHYM